MSSPQNTIALVFDYDLIDLMEEREEEEEQI